MFFILDMTNLAWRQGDCNERQDKTEGAPLGTIHPRKVIFSQCLPGTIESVSPDRLSGQGDLANPPGDGFWGAAKSKL